MSHDEDMRAAAMRALPALPRILFRLHNFYDVDLDTLAERLAADRADIIACLAEARSMVHGYSPWVSGSRFDPDGPGLAVARLEDRLRREYRAWLEDAFAESGYAGAVAWPDPSTAIKADEEAAAAFVVSFLRAPLRRAVARSHRADVATADLWRCAWRWQTRMRARLLEVTSELGCSGWQAFDIWLADRVAPDRYYPGGYIYHQRRRRLLPEEMSPQGGCTPQWSANLQRQFDSLSGRTRQVYILFHGYGRSSYEIEKRLGISRRDVRRRLRRAAYLIMDRPEPSLAWSIAFDIRMRWATRKGQFKRAWAALSN